MKILVLGPDNSITDTIRDMLETADGWLVETITDFIAKGTLQLDTVDKKAVFDIIAANLCGFPEPPKTISEKIAAQFPEIPILVLYSYSQKSLIKPLVENGATGYLQVGTSETKLYEAVKKVAAGKKHIFTGNTY